jgi:hypothetical protein
VIKGDLQSYKDMGRGLFPFNSPSQCTHQGFLSDFPPGVFIDHLRDLVLHRVKMVVGKDSNATFPVPKADVLTVTPQFKDVLDNQSTKLRQVHALRIRRSPKRRAISEESEGSRYAFALSFVVPDKLINEKQIHERGKAVKIIIFSRV